MMPVPEEGFIFQFYPRFAKLGAGPKLRSPLPFNSILDLLSMNGNTGKPKSAIFQFYPRFALPVEQASVRSVLSFNSILDLP